MALIRGDTSSLTFLFDDDDSFDRSDVEEGGEEERMTAMSSCLTFQLGFRRTDGGVGGCEVCVGEGV